MSPPPSPARAFIGRVLFAATASAAGSKKPGRPALTGEAARAGAARAYGELPLQFERNERQAAARSDFARAEVVKAFSSAGEYRRRFGRE